MKYIAFFLASCIPSVALFSLTAFVALQPDVVSQSCTTEHSSTIAVFWGILGFLTLFAPGVTLVSIWDREMR